MKKGFVVTDQDIINVLNAFGLSGTLKSWHEISRYHYTGCDEGQVRLVLYVQLADGEAYVMKFLKEKDHPRSQVEEQSAFSEFLREKGILCAQKFLINEVPHSYTALLTVDDHDVYVTTEQFEHGEIKSVNTENAFRIGALHGQAHTISERNNCHVSGKTLFDPFCRNELFFYNEFSDAVDALPAAFGEIVSEIKLAYRHHLDKLSPLKKVKKYAVQGDMSNNNLFVSSGGEIGMFDFNNCADNRLLCDTILQGIFISRLMDYDEAISEELSCNILKSFLQGYTSVRTLSDEEWAWVPHLYAITTAFWGPEIVFDPESLKALCMKYYESKTVALEKSVMDKLVDIRNALLDRKAIDFFRK